MFERALFPCVALFAVTGSAAPAVTQRPESDLMLLAVQLDSEVLSEAIPSYVGADGLLIPLRELSSVLGLAITVRQEEGLAEGWAFSEGRRFVLHMGSGIGSFDGTTVSFTDVEVERHPEDLFVDIELFSKLLPIDVTVDLRKAVLLVKPRELLPIQLQRERLRKLAQLSGAQGYQPHLPELELPYALWKAPSVDQTATLGMARGGIGPFLPRLSYSTTATGELLYLQTDLFVSGYASQEGATTPELRAHAGRKDAEAELLGPLKATSFGVGDVLNPGVDLIGGSGSGAGLEVSNRPLMNPTHFDRNTFRGNLATGWDVELYRNGVLMGFQTAAADGRYEFADVPLLFGINVFRLVFHGPQGQLREEREIYNVGSNAVPDGKLYYRATANAPGAVFGRPLNLHTRRALLEMDYGIRRDVSAGAAIVTLYRDGADRVYAKTGLRGFYKWLIASGDVAAELGGGVAAQARTTGQFGSVTVAAQHTHLWDYQSEQLSSVTGLRGRTLLRAAGVVRVSQRVSIPLDAELGRDWMSSRPDLTYVTVGTAAQVRNVSFAHRLRWPLEGPGPASPIGNAIAIWELGSIGLRANADYQLTPGLLRTASLTAESRRLQNFFVSGTFRWTAFGGLGGSASLGKTQGAFGISLNGAYSQSGGASASIGVSVAFRHDEREGLWRVQAQNAARTGATSAQVFLDRNGNGTRDPDEEALEDVELAVNGSSAGVRTDAKGVAVLREMTPFSAIDISLVEHSLADPYWRSARRGYQVTPRPGRMVTVDLPVQVTGEVTGTVYLRREKDRHEFPGVDVEFVSESGRVTRTRSAYDGFYTMPELLAGKYTVRVAANSLIARGLSPPPQREIEILPDGTVVDGFDLVIEGGAAAVAAAEGPLRLPVDPNAPFEIQTPGGPMRVRLLRVVRFPLASWAAGLPLSEEEIEGLDLVGQAMEKSKTARLVIISHAQTVGPPEGALKRAKKGAEGLRRYLKAVQFIPSKKVTISIIPQEPQSEPLGYIELGLVEPVEPVSTGTGATAALLLPRHEWVN